jgi:phage portal protein BeeE
LTKGWVQPPFWSVAQPIFSTSWGRTERLAVDFERYVGDVYQRDGIVYACIAARAMVFSQARFLWQRYENGQPSELFGTRALSILEIPWENGSTADLLARAEQDVSLAGNFFATIIDDRDGRRFRRLRPDWVTIVTGSRLETDPNRVLNAPDARVIAYIYEPPSARSRGDYENIDFREPAVFEPADIVHYAEMHDPLYNWRGMSWLTPVIREIQGDMAATEHKLAFFRNGATPSMAIRYDASISKEAFEAFVARFQRDHEGGPEKGYRTLHLGGGADVTTLTHDFKQLDFKNTQGAGETRIAAAARVHPVIVGLAEGLQGSSLNAGNFGAARRLFVDGCVRYLWAKMAPALESVLEVPAGCRLAVDDRHIPFLREDAVDEARIRHQNAMTIRQLIDAGFKPDAVVDAVMSGDLKRLVKAHTGLYSVQLQPPGQLSTGEL